MNAAPAGADAQRAMPDRVLPARGGRGADLLLAHCDALTRVDDARPPVSERLEELVGSDLARLLVGALAGRRAREVEFAA
jgi:hypothetical protein